MTANASEVVLILPNDDVDAILAKIYGARSKAIQLLVPDITPSLQSSQNIAQLERIASASDISLTIISSDEQVLAAAQQHGLDVIGVAGAQVSTPPATPGGLVTRPLEVEPQPHTAFEPTDAAFLDELDSIPADSLYSHTADDRDLYDVDDLDDLDAEPQPRRPERVAPAYDEYDDDDDIDDIYEDERTTQPVAPYRPDPRRTRSYQALSQHADTRALTRGEAAYPARPSRRNTLPDYDEYDEVAPRRRSFWLFPLLLGMVALAVLVGFWFYLNRPVVYVWPPASTITSYPFTNEALPLADSATSADATAIQALPVNTSAQFVAQGQASQQLTPVGVARGAVRIINALPSPVDLPAGTEFVATNAEGQEVRFLIDAPATVPPAVTSTSILGSSTSFGDISIQVSARSPGSASNVGENSITQLVIPGQPPIPNGGQVRLLNQPLSGGSEELVAIVSLVDVERVISDTLTSLYQTGINELQNQPLPDGYVLDETTVAPDPQAFGDPVNYEQPEVTPAIGQPVDAANPVFTVTLRADFSALATPRDAAIARQMETVAPRYFLQEAGRNPCQPNEKKGLDITRISWTGQQLIVDGAATCQPPLPPLELNRLKNSIVGKSSEEANENLRAAQNAGLIGAYQLPNVQRFAPFGLFVDVEQGSDAGPSQPTTATAEPSSTEQPLQEQLQVTSEAAQEVPTDADAAREEQP